MKCPKCGLENLDSALKCDCGYEFSSAKITQPNMGGTEKKKKESQPWANAIFSGLVSGVIAGLSTGFGGGWYGFVAWMGCYLLFLHWLKPFSRKLVAIIIMIVVGSLISVIVQGIR